MLGIGEIVGGVVGCLAYFHGGDMVGYCGVVVGVHGDFTHG